MDIIRLPRRGLLLALALTAAAVAGLLAAPAAAAAGSGAPGPAPRGTAARGPAATAEAYLQARAAAVTAARPARVLAPFVGVRNRLAAREAAVAHGLALRQADLGHALDAVTCVVTVAATKVDPVTGVAAVTAHAVTSLEWHAAGGTSTEAAGLDHRIRLAPDGGGWRVVADRYTDLQAPALLERAGVCAASVERAASRLERAGVPDPAIASGPGDGLAPGPSGDLAAAPGGTPAGLVGYTDRIYYDRDAVKTYADRYALSYNPTYVRFSADCCNFVSQSAYAGHMPQALGSWETGWWYDKDGSSGTGDDSWSWSWISCTKQIGYWIGRRTDWVSGISGVGKGDAIYYDWTNDGAWDHVAVLVGTNSAGQKVIDAHTTDYYRVFWKLGSSVTRYGFAKVRAYWVI